MCGHSLGELIALCFAGIYAPEVAWYILDTRAIHMAELEAKATRETGMMAVHADAEVIARTRETWPALYVSNYNTPKQHILSGPREVLQEARKSLRKARIPAMMLNVGLAFHHPSMRILRDMSLRRLNALAMRAPRLPMLSDITTGFYPEDQPSICRFITDLDENSVRWVECVQAMYQRDAIRHFLELGPQDTLCGLVGDIEPRALCFSVGRKGHETESMRQACARLYALGHLPTAAIRQRCSARKQEEPVLSPRLQRSEAVTPAGRELPLQNPQLLRTVQEILAAACGRAAEEILPGMDLRYDLALRSSRFPLLIQEVEAALNMPVDFEQLLHVTTVADLVRVLARIQARTEEGQASAQDTAQLTAPESPAAGPDGERLYRMLAGEVFSGQEYLLFRRAGSERQAIAAQYPESCSLAFVDPAPPLPQADNLLQACCHFSRYADTALSGHGTPVQLPTSRILQALLEGAAMLLPEMAVNGLSDVRLASPLPLPSGVTRECRLRAQARLLLEQDGVPSRMCYTWLSARTLKANGRRTTMYAPLAEAMLLLADRPAPIAPIWHDVPQATGRPLPATTLAKFYTAHGLEHPWRLLTSWTALPENTCRACFNAQQEGKKQEAGPDASIAPAGLCRYTLPLRMVEAVIQAAQIFLEHEGQEAAPSWQLGTM
ncbi:MAG: acyltransferase domain-containing protein, partial [Desulfovibrionaceae bacterium]|nr:acyltransferase domain-containing protein [Desulfovibrionaceae bacterium]